MREFQRFNGIQVLVGEDGYLVLTQPDLLGGDHSYIMIPPYMVANVIAAMRDVVSDHKPSE